MKDNDNILTLPETEELCRAYMECRLSVLEERELQYVLTKLPYHSDLIDETRNLMISEGFAFPEKRRKRSFRLRFRELGAAVAVCAAIAVGISFLTHRPDSSVAGQAELAQTERASKENNLISESDEDVTIAYERGRRLSPEESEKAVEESMKRAQALIAMAERREKEDEMKREHLMSVMNENE